MWVFHVGFKWWSFAEFWMTPRVSWTILIIVAVFNSVVVWMVSIRYLILRIARSLFQVFGDRYKYTNYKWYHGHLYIPQLFSSGNISLSLSLSIYIYIAFFFFFFFLDYLLERQNSPDHKFFSLCIEILAMIFWTGLSDPILSRSFYRILPNILIP